MSIHQEPLTEIELLADSLSHWRYDACILEFDEEDGRRVDLLDHATKLAAALSEWRPIDTAPKDGERILIHVPLGRRKVYEAWYARPHEAAGPSVCWWQTADGTVLVEHATEWMPLPPPPVPAKLK